MERLKLSKEEKYILLELGKTESGLCNTSNLSYLTNSEIKCGVESLEYKKLASNNVPLNTNEGTVVQVALTQMGKQYLKENPKLKNPNKILDVIKRDSRPIIVYVIGAVLAAALVLYLGLK